LSSSRIPALALSGLAVGLSVALSLSGCARAPYNTPLAHYDRSTGYRAPAPEAAKNTDAIQVILTFSGGGTRAAALSYGVLKALRETPIRGNHDTLLDEVDLISTVSGGSFTGAYYALYGEEIFNSFESRFLKRNIQSDLKSKLFNPGNWYRLSSPYFSRIHLASELYDDTVFGHKTFGDLLARKSRPFLVMNATAMSLGTTFEFTQNQFDALGSDLSTYPIAPAVAASSAFPILLSPMTLKNCGQPEGYAEPPWIENALQDRDRNIRRYVRAKSLRTFSDKENHPWVHLMDGGLADNLGLRPVINRILDPEDPGSVAKLLQEGKVKKLVVIVVNAKVEPQESIDRMEGAPGVLGVAMKTMTISMDNYSFDSVEWLRAAKRERDQAAMDLEELRKVLKDCGKPLGFGPLPPVDIYLIEVSFDSIQDSKERAYFLSLPTSFYLPPATVDQVVAEAGVLLRSHPDYRRLVKDLE
jgi:NTE family protein